MEKINKIIIFLLLTVVIFSEEDVSNKEELQNLKVYKRGERERAGGIDYILNNKSPYNLLFYFKVYEKPGNFQYLNEALKFFDINSLDNHYSSRRIKLENGDNFSHGRISLDFNSTRLKLELYYIGKNNEEKKKVYLKDMDFKIFGYIDKLNKNTEEGYYVTSTFGEEITILTANKIIHKKVYFLSDMEKKLYEALLETFKNEIPKEFFELKY